VRRIVDHGQVRLERHAVRRGPAEAGGADGHLLVVMEEQGQGVGERDPERLDDVALAIGFWRGRHAAERAAVAVDGLDGQDGVRAFHGHAPEGC
jgi:hypothetical protein